MTVDPNQTSSKYANRHITPWGLVLPTVNVNYFETKTNVIKMIQNSYTFRGLPIEDSHVHIANFFEICALLS